ncbi:hypothetical protein A3K86_14940 [Photobacterium jeanii]|uniref:Energy transducer TonB n=1 Tax=Photobacterium jeanii TaxID=858640 RepID=A0A178K7B6_9GAMM|nr:DUF3450 domain-containing protein [Photobacterium jeanii]OAN12966.1 hypothetical protein A3K86_14940 [Photobacterium jeanii]PST89114.1 DUF3450 domain-containing protein [Photobacterium jeanii]
MKGFKPSLVFLALSVAYGAQANSLDSARAVENKINHASSVSQKKIDKSAEQALSMKAEIEQLQEEVENLTVYRDHMARLVANQEEESASLSDQIQGIKETRQGVVPLMYKMIDGLQTIITDDKPIKRDQRLARVAKLKLMMSQADISDAEKYRRILEAYQIEMDYGTKLGVYQGELALSDADSIEAELLYLGRISLVARSLDGQRYWAWNEQQSSWQSLDSQYASDVDKAFAIANKQVAPSLINLPVSLHTAATNVETK